MKLTLDNIVIFSECISFTEGKSAIFNVDIYLKNTQVDITTNQFALEKVGRANVMLNFESGNSSTDFEISNCEFDSVEIINFITKKCFNRCLLLLPHI